MPDLLWPIEAMRQAPAQVAVAAAAVAVVDQPVIMQVVTATAIIGRARDIAPKRMWHSCKKTAERPADFAKAAAAVVAPTAPTAMTTVRSGPATVTASTPT